MIHLYDQHAVRKTQSLDGLWTYVFPVSGTTIDLHAAPTSPSVEVLRLPVPGVWESHPTRVNYRGQALAIREVVLEHAGPVRLVFAGVSHTCFVYWDGELLGTHHNAYTGFTFTVAQAKAGRHEIRLHITNEHGEISALHIPNDYYNYGGISRPTQLEILPSEGVYITLVHLRPGLHNDPRRVRCAVTLRNISDHPFQGSLQVKLAHDVQHLPLTLGGQQSQQYLCELYAEQLPLWEPDAPVLHLVSAELLSHGKVIDDHFERTGLRTVGTHQRKILLNGKAIRLGGFNRHEDHPDYGCAIPLQIMIKDIQLMRHLGANAVRTSHYPNDSRFLDLCDEFGLLVFEENHARGLRDEKFEHPRLREQCRAVNEEMVAQHYNHPSIVMWGILNECMSDSEAGRAVYQEQFAQIRALDDSRPLTYATFRMREDLCQDLPDICSWNQYPNWYIHSKPNECLQIIFDHQDARGLRDRPLMISEFGAGGITGFRDPIRRGKWSEERQSDLLQELFADYCANERVEGLFVWQFCDIRVDESWAMGRPRTMNNKGIVDEYRRPKLAADVVRHYLTTWLGGKHRNP